VVIVSRIRCLNSPYPFRLTHWGLISRGCAHLFVVHLDARELLKEIVEEHFPLLSSRAPF